MNYGNIKSYDIADGTGVRVSLFVSGCRHHCKGCFNAPTWDFNYGKPFTRETQDKLLELLAPSYIEGFSLLGGEPFEPDAFLHRRSGRRRVYSGIEKPLPSVQREQQSANSAFKRW